MLQPPNEDLTQQAREEVNSWVARFVPLVMSTETLDTTTTKERLALVKVLTNEENKVSQSIAKLNALEDSELISTYRQARSQLSSIESDLKRKLGKLAPGDPQSAADLDALQERLAENAAKIELGVDTSPSVGEFNEITSPSNPAAAIGMFIFGLGWNAFTLFHATIMIGGMWLAFGPGALAMLLFYAIFFFAGFAMWASAYISAAQESVELSGDKLTIFRKLGPISTTKVHKIDLSSNATIGKATINGMSQKNSIPTRAVILTDINGGPINIALQTTDSKRKEICARLNSQLEATRSE